MITGQVVVVTLFFLREPNLLGQKTKFNIQITYPYATLKYITAKTTEQQQTRRMS